MKRRIILAVAFVNLLAGTGAAQQREFLTADETDQVRLAQDPNERLKLYVYFARQRLDMLQQILGKEKAGRTALAHDTLEQYTQIIDAIDTVADDALKRKLDINLGMAEVAKGEKELLAALRKIEESRPKDAERYEFALKQAIETTQDSLDLSLEDLSERSTAVAEKAEKDRKAIEASMQPKDLEEKRAAEKKTAETERKRKPPTLLRKGETLKK